MPSPIILEVSVVAITLLPLKDKTEIGTTTTIAVSVDNQVSIEKLHICSFTEEEMIQ